MSPYVRPMSYDLPTKPSPDERGDRAPIVTVFGAGVAGLSVAHELIERGLAVQVVEERKSRNREYECEVGGLAGNQFGRIRADLARLHPHLYREDGEPYLEDARDAKGGSIEDPDVVRGLDQSKEERRRSRSLVDDLGAGAMVRVQRQYALPQRIRFQRKKDRDRKAGDGSGSAGSAPAEKPEEWEGLGLHLGARDDWGRTNAKKLEEVWGTIRRAYDDYTKDLAEKLERLGRKGDSQEFLAPVLRRETLVVEIRGRTDSDGRPRKSRKRGKRWARAVKRYLEHHNSQQKRPIPELGHHLVVIGVGAKRPVGEQRRKIEREASCFVEFRIVEHEVPGEHGYRFFPAFYRHIFDVMKRTPILDHRGRETGQTARDQLVATSSVGLALEDGRPPKTIPRRRWNLEEYRRSLEVMMEDMGVTARDRARYEVRMWKFLTSCSQRRKAECEGISWWEYIGGNQGGGYSEKAGAILRKTPQALIAMSAQETDARTHGDISVQLFVDQFGSGENVDMTLNGPTSDAWLYHWKRYLKRQGVRFFVGSLEKLQVDDDGDVVPVVKNVYDRDSLEPTPEVPYHRYLAHGNEFAAPDFYVLALPYDQTRRVVLGLQQGGTALQGDFLKLAEFDEQTEGARDPEKIKSPFRRSKLGRPSGTDPFRDLSGIQYYFNNHVRIGEGHIYFPHSPWGLSSISQVSHWRTRLSPTSAFLGQVSVDLGDFYTPHDRPPHESAWNCSAERIAKCVWEQICDGLDVNYAGKVADPSFYHLDEHLEFASAESDPHRERIIENKSAFLINLPGQWEMRPGLLRPGEEPTQPRLRLAEKTRETKPEQREDREIWYQVGHDRWLLAGAYMATYTRLTTMEAANESARHAVNAILHQIAEEEKDPKEPRYNASGTLMGDYCRIWPLEDYEIDELKALKRLDQRLVDEGLPHVFDILRLADLVERMPVPEEGLQGPVGQLLRLLREAQKSFSDEWEFARGAYSIDWSSAVGNLEELMGRLREWLRTRRPAG